MPALQFPISLAGELCLKGGLARLGGGVGDLLWAGGRGWLDLNMLGSNNELLWSFSLNGFEIIFLVCSC